MKCINWERKGNFKSDKKDPLFEIWTRYNHV